MDHLVQGTITPPRIRVAATFARRQISEFNPDARVVSQSHLGFALGVSVAGNWFGRLGIVTQSLAFTAQSSIELLARSQTSDGAFPASTQHEIYQYGGLRDGSWCAYALDRVGPPLAAAAWHRWVASTLLRHEHRVDEALEAVRDHRVNGAVMMPARFTLAGQEETP